MALASDDNLKDRLELEYIAGGVTAPDLAEKYGLEREMVTRWMSAGEWTRKKRELREENKRRILEEIKFNDYANLKTLVLPLADIIDRFVQNPSIEVTAQDVVQAVKQLTVLLGGPDSRQEQTIISYNFETDSFPEPKVIDGEYKELIPETADKKTEQNDSNI